MPGLPQLSFALGRTAEPLTWFGTSSKPVRIVFLSAVPESGAEEYLNLVSGFAKLSRDRFYAEQLLDAPDAQALFEILNQIPLRQPHGGAQNSSETST
jgi:mannitol/fructose-specific phosphotransferase system IIA component (Ntr-type)